MSGFIWSAMGNAVGNAGNAISGMMMRDIEDQRRREEEDRKEANYIKRLEEADRIKSERDQAREEALQQRVIKDTQKARARGQEIGRAREAAAYDRLAESSALAGEQGDIALSKEQLAEFSRQNPSIARQYQSMGLIDRNLPITAQQRRLQSAEDEIAGAMETGAHSSVIKGFQDIRRGVLEEIREENKDARDRAREERLDAEGRRRDERFAAAEERRSKEFQALLPIRQQQADAATTRAERPDKSKDTNESLNAQAETLRKAVKEATGDRRARLQQDLDDVLAEQKRRREQNSAPAPSGAASAPGNNRSSTGTTRNYSNLWN